MEMRMRLEINGRGRDVLSGTFVASALLGSNSCWRFWNDTLILLEAFPVPILSTHLHG